MDFLRQRLHSAELFAAKLEKNKFLLFLGFTVLYLVTTYKLSREKLMWNDELYTYYIARLPAMTDVWGALMSGGEQLPPFFYLVTRASIGLFGVNNLAFRLPEMIGFWIACLCLFIFVSRRASNFYGLLAAIFPLVTFTYYYAYEARPYGLLLGFSALALLCWQSLTMNRWRTVSIICLTLSLGAALSVHYYGVLVIFPLALGETVRTFSGRRLDAPVWAAFFLAMTPLLWHLPLIRQARAYSSTFWSHPQWMNIPDYYFNTLYMAVLPLVWIIFLAGIYQTVLRGETSSENRQTTPETMPPPIFEVVAAVGFITMPVVASILAKFVTGAFNDRYVVSAIIGLSILISFIAARLYNNSALFSAVLVICFVGWFGVLVFKDYWKPAEDWGAYPETKIQLLQLKGENDLPIVAADPYTFIELEHYAPPEISSRVVYLADPEASLRRLNHNSIERGMVDLLKPWFGLKVTDYNSYIASRPQFLLCGNPEFFSWIVPELEQDGMRLEFRGNKGRTFLFFVSPAARETVSSR